MENQNKYLLLARRAREEDNAEDAKKYYDIVRTEDPDNAEAKFFYGYYKLFSGTQGQAYGNYVDFCNGIPSTLSMVIKSDVSNEEKNDFLNTMYCYLTNAYRTADSANTNIGGDHGSSIGDLYWNACTQIAQEALTFFPGNTEWESVIRTSEKVMYEKQKLHLLYGGGSLVSLIELGDEIESKYSSEPEFMEIAVDCWQSAIYEAQTFYSTPRAKTFNEKVDMNAYVAKIKKHRPSYVMPKKAGCISFAK